MFTIVASSTTISCAPAMTSSTRPGRAARRAPRSPARAAVRLALVSVTAELRSLSLGDGCVSNLDPLKRDALENATVYY